MRKMSKVQGLHWNQTKGKCGLIFVSRACLTGFAPVAETLGSTVCFLLG